MPDKRARKTDWNVAAAVAASVILMLFIGSCRLPTPTEPTVSTTTTTTTTTTSTTSTTTTTGPGPTTTTTTTTSLVNYATQIHPIWDKETCLDCHVSGNPLDLSGTPTESCANIAARDGSNDNLIITGAGRAGSEILEKPEGKVSHVGGAYGCFGGVGAQCYDLILAWLGQGAMGPTATPCGG